MASTFRFITFLSDYGLEDEFVGVCRGVVKRFAPEVEILDIAHGIPPQDVAAGATVLAQAVRYMPAAVHLAIVDPGVGTPRRAVAIQTASGSPLVGPDNGVLWLAAEALGGATRAFSITNESLFLDAPSRTFHGRDIFAPAAAHLARGVEPARLGPPVTDPVRLSWPGLRVSEGKVGGAVVHVDRFGNLVTSIPADAIASLGSGVTVRIAGKSLPLVRTYGDLGRNDPGALLGSSNRLEIAVNAGSAAKTLRAGLGTPVVVSRTSSSSTRRAWRRS